VEGGKKPPFNVASVRRLNMARKDEFNTPGPSSYDIKPKPFKSRSEHASANFVSNTVRETIVEVNEFDEKLFIFELFLFVKGYSRSYSLRCFTCLSSTYISTSTTTTFEKCSETT
jgi:hypothetical protein